VEQKQDLLKKSSLLMDLTTTDLHLNRSMIRLEQRMLMQFMLSRLETHSIMDMFYY
jgi:hypothetical protein